MNETLSHACRVAIALILSLMLIIAAVLMHNLAAQIAVAVIIFIIHALATDSAWPIGNRWLLMQTVLCLILEVTAISIF
ncbi:MAG: hypothetical protein HRU15_17520 [Planctomycetes bacterium]|nr:hypothetical protein [Planctomycetota bacterium]